MSQRFHSSATHPRAMVLGSERDKQSSVCLWKRTQGQAGADIQIQAAPCASLDSHVPEPLFSMVRWGEPHSLLPED